MTLHAVQDVLCGLWRKLVELAGERTRLVHQKVIVRGCGPSRVFVTDESPRMACACACACIRVLKFVFKVWGFWTLFLHPRSYLVPPLRDGGEESEECTQATTRRVRVRVRERRLSPLKEIHSFPPAFLGFRLGSGAGEALSHLLLSVTRDGVPVSHSSSYVFTLETRADVNPQREGTSSAINSRNIIIFREYFNSGQHPSMTPAVIGAPRIFRAGSDQSLFGRLARHRGLGLVRMSFQRARLSDREQTVLSLRLFHVDHRPP
jgi:hypothetical protein